MLSSNLKKLRLSKGMTQEELASSLHVVRQTVSKWESGLSAPDAEMLVGISEILQVPVSSLLGGGEAPPEEELSIEALAERLAELNARLAAQSRKRRLRLRVLSICGLVCVAAFAVWCIASSIYINSLPVIGGPASIATVGGADGPTSIYVSRKLNPTAIFAAAAVLALSVYGLILSGRR